MQGFFVLDVGQVSGMEQFSWHSWSRLKLSISFPLHASRMTDCGSLGVMMSIASGHGASLNFCFAMSAAM